jgi:predicted Rossmann-fold nucleotide-binding protein
MLQVPLVLVGSEFWGGLLDWVKAIMLEKEKNISPQDVQLLKLADSAEEAVQHILDFYSKHPLQPNF